MRLNDCISEICTAYMQHSPLYYNGLITPAITLSKAMLRDTYTDLLRKYTDDNTIMTRLWIEVETSYSASTRHYHTLTHLANMLGELRDVKNEIKDWDTILFSVFYHDVVYDVSSLDNEEQSAVLATERMAGINVPMEVIDRCQTQILATKGHQQDKDAYTNYFIDADLSVLGQDWDTYSAYYKGIRKEYAIYPDELYNPGRKKVLTHFLSMDRIFKSDYFYQKFEGPARQNLQREMELL